ncbi:MAG: ATP-binding protein, partial [Proteobacteria bacterium]|nr:ATP-binding protein [Pseudomonadota bacterium]
AGSPFVAEYLFSRSSGELAWIHVKGRVIGHAPNLRVLGTVVDISEKKLLDGRLRLADRLIAAGTMAAGVAHEINNPLSFVLGNVELVRMQLLELPNIDPKVHDAVDRMLDGIDRIRAVVADLRTFARPEEDLVTRVELAAVCDAALRVVASTIRHRASLTVDHAANTPAVIANSSRLGQVIINLIVNASDAMADLPSADNRIHLRTRRLATGEAVIEVEDNGAGIASAILPQLFDPFFTTKGTSEGTGLGLAVCQSIIASMHGRIEVESAPGRGATFSVVLPAAPPQLEPVEAPAVPRPASSRRILVIDDEPMLRNVLEHLLSKLGYEVVSATSGQRGIELACSESFDVVLCDLMMPEVDGVAVHDEVLAARPDVARRIVYITGGPVTDRARTFAERTDIMLLAKPFSVAALVEAIERVER